MPEITTPRELFLHELGDILYVEEQLVSEVLPKLIGEVNDEELQSARHRLASAPLLALRATRSPFSHGSRHATNGGKHGW